VDGVKLPFTLRRLGENGGSILRVKETRQNVPIDDAKFNKPSP